MGASWTDIGTFVLGCVLLVGQVARWAGGIEERRATKRRDIRETVAQTPGHNGTPSLGEISRRLDASDQQNARDHQQMRDEYRAIANAQTRRIDDLLGQ